MAAPAPPNTHHLPLARALDQSESLSGLLRRLRESEARLTAVRHCLPEPLHAAVRAGPLDDQSWSLLVGNASTAAKLRQLVPTIETALADAGWPVVALRVKIMASR
jgi:hypothetical protein